MSAAQRAMAACLAALATGCPGLLPATDRAFDAAVAADVPAGTPDRGPAVDAPAVMSDRPATMDVPAVPVDRPSPTDVVTVVGDSGPAPDTGAVTLGTDAPGCGRHNAPCCEGATCRHCGNEGEPCCAFGGLRRRAPVPRHPGPRSHVPLSAAPPPVIRRAL